MVKNSEEELVCDFAEYYHIYDYRALPLSTVATLSCGLRADSRSMMKLRDDVLTLDQTFSALIYDQLRLLVWMHTKDAQKGRGRPVPFLDELKKQRDEVSGFDSPEAFEKARNKILQQVE